MKKTPVFIFHIIRQKTYVNQFKPGRESFNNYLLTGGMPEYVKNNRGAILQQLIDDILYRDIAVRHNIRHVNALRELTVFLVSNIGKQVSARRLTGLFGIAATTTIIDYFAYLRNSYVVDFVPRFDYSLKAQNRNPKKVYAIDLGVFHQIKNSFTEDAGRQLENAVYLHLRRKHKEIFYFNKNGECDFVVFNKGKALQCIQVCHKVNDMNMERELKGLKNAMEVFDTSISISGPIRPAKIIPASVKSCLVSSHEGIIVLIRLPDQGFALIHQMITIVVFR